MVLQSLELLDQLRRQQLSPRAHDLPELHKGGAEFLDGQPDPFVHGGRFRHTAGNRKPYPGMFREQLF